MKLQFPKSKCQICNSEYAAKDMKRHIKACLKKHLKDTKNKKAGYYMLHIYSNFTKNYFLYLLASQTTQLKRLDTFLRDIWLECCGHMSAFFDRGFNEIPMSNTLLQLSKTSKDIIYQYDFGSTTELLINIIDTYNGPAGFKDIIILARNAQFLIPCDICGKEPAVKICPECQWNDEGWLCEKCARGHECEEEILLPVCNSPRSGVCGYQGEYKEIGTDNILRKFLAKS